MTDSEYIAELNALSDLSLTRGWVLLSKYMDALVADSYQALIDCQSSNAVVVSGFARELKRKREIVSSIKGFVQDKHEEKLRLQADELEEQERQSLIEQLGEKSEYSTNNA